MFHQVSWVTYFIALAAVAGIYYGIIVPLFFKKQIRRFFSGQRSSQAGWQSEDAPEAAVNDYFTYEKLRDEVTAYLEAEQPGTLKSDILFSIASIVKRHPALEDERFQGALGKEIRRMYNEKYSDPLSEGELTAIWQI